MFDAVKEFQSAGYGEVSDGYKCHQDAAETAWTRTTPGASTPYLYTGKGVHAAVLLLVEASAWCR